ncbi:MAG: hypothetical protein KatS3mg043_0870 [Rhodothermaceae bacterium]|nr:MAG: hypothetical protein KatS3mg043_0870 [Rhodothermaceae bacterium]
MPDVFPTLLDKVDTLDPMARPLVLKALVELWERHPDLAASLPASLKTYLIEMLDDPDDTYAAAAARGLHVFLDDETVDALLHHTGQNDTLDLEIFGPSSTTRPPSRASCGPSSRAGVSVVPATQLVLGLLAQQALAPELLAHVGRFFQHQFHNLDVETKLAALTLYRNLQHPALHPLLYAALADDDPEVTTYAADLARETAPASGFPLPTSLHRAPPADHDPCNTPMSLLAQLNLPARSPAASGKAELPDPLFEQFRRFIYEQTGIYFQDNKKYLLESRVGRRLTATGTPDYQAYFHYLLNGGAATELPELINAVTINETFFFRTPPQFEIIEEHIIPELVAQRTGPAPTLRLWSAACSTGDEPYSLALIVRDRLQARYPRVRFEIYGTDINTEVLERPGLAPMARGPCATCHRRCSAATSPSNETTTRSSRKSGRRSASRT